MRSLVTGGSGFVGRHLVSSLDRPVVIGRDAGRIKTILGDVEARQWTPPSPPDPQIFHDIDTVYHLAGESVFKGRWNRAKKEKILRSRIDSTRQLVETLASLKDPPRTLICASGVGYYGSQGETLLTESAAPGNDFLADVCKAWEAEAARAEIYGMRVVQVRIGIVLGKDGGALPRMITPFRLGAGGRIGTGRQYMSWIHIDDLIGIMLFCASDTGIRGPVNGAAPAPVTNGAFTDKLAAVLHRPAFFHVPGTMLRITLGEFADVLLGSQRAVPEKLTAAGYTFLYPDLSAALHNLLR